MACRLNVSQWKKAVLGLLGVLILPFWFRFFYYCPLNIRIPSQLFANQELGFFLLVTGLHQRAPTCMEEATEYADNVVLCNGGTWASSPAMPLQRQWHEAPLCRRIGRTLFYAGEDAHVPVPEHMPAAKVKKLQFVKSDFQNLPPKNEIIIVPSNPLSSVLECGWSV